MIKFRLMFDKDKETKWLNEMVNNGWAMKSFFAGFYTFEACEKGEYIYQIDLGEKFGDVTEDYREFMKESGVEIVQCWGYWVILRKKASEGDFELYTDVDSSIEHYTKIRKIFKAAGIFEVLLVILEFIIYAVTESYSALVCAILVSCLVAVFLVAVYRTTQRIDALTEKKTGIPVQNDRKNVSPLLTVGLLFNMVAIISRDGISDGIVTVIQIAALLLMVAGLYQLFKNRSR